MKKTEWFPAHIKPVHEGVYETRWRTCWGHYITGRSKWNGVKWSNQNKTFKFNEQAKQDKEWCGVLR
jgi:hypothetical protein